MATRVYTGGQCTVKSDPVATGTPAPVKPAKPAANE